MSGVIELTAVDFSYGSVATLSGIDLQVVSGEFLGIVGPNAGGKSTLLKLILGQLSPQRGTIEVLQQAPRSASRRIGYVPQFPSFPRHFPITVEQVVMLGRLGSKRSSSRAAALWPERLSHDDKQAANQILTVVEAQGIAKRSIDSLSGGQLQRVLLARALVAEPEILILDEPTANIDQRMEYEIFDLLRLLNERMTILVVSHDVAFISGYVSRVACLNRTLVCHATESIGSDVIRDLYGDDVRKIAHGH